MKKSRRTILNTGTTSLILIFVVAALVVFALLSLSASNAQWRLAQKMAERTTTYYKAENQAERTLLEVSRMLEKTAEESDAENFLQQVSERVPEWTEIEETLRWEDGSICWETAISGKQQLSAALLPVYPEREGETPWRLERWQVTDRESWENRQSLELYQTAG